MKFLRYAVNTILLLLLLWALGFAVYIFSSLSMKPEKPDRATDAVVVLTGGDKRVETGLSLLADGQSKYLFISGVNPQVTEGEIRVMWKGQPPLPACCIALGRHSGTTIENARETREWIESMKFSSIRLVTANYHMHRALLELSHVMPDLEIIPHPIVPPDVPAFSRKYWILLLSEYNKILLRTASLAFRHETAS
jgi:uncharacterized SAM-binding protein YcdF (DUF218 family)